MDRSSASRIVTTIPRRDLLSGIGGGFAGIALSQLLGQSDLLAKDAGVGAPRADLNGGIHHRAKAKRIVQLFMNGGASQVDTFDPKPRLTELDGQKFDPGSGEKVESVTGSAGFKVLKSPFDFKRHGDCGRWVSSVLPHMAGIVDDLTFLTSMVTKSNVHGLASYMQNTGFVLPGFPCMGAWISYALGRINDNLPAFIVMPDARGLPYNNQGNFSAGFLPAQHQGTLVKASSPNPISHLMPPKEAGFVTPESESEGRELLQQMNRAYQEQHPGDSRLGARIESYELAAKMQLSVPELFDLKGESKDTLSAYGVNEAPTEDFGRRCLLARRMLERGVRFVQVWSGAGGPTKNWDNHANIPTELPAIASQVDKPAAALVRDLKQRGMLEDTLVIWTTEFGRMPFSQGSAGRDHNGGTFVTWLAGAGLKPGVAYGESDEWGWKALTPIPCYDLHATILHLLGIDHTKLTFRHNGIDRRLTDVHGHVLDPILA
ncbi:MAG: DUF1501 domain-containing protein [Phycisphaera sp.]|nr:DUF1501 domain-containing protein [Phycisphaera sp.]